MLVRIRLKKSLGRARDERGQATLELALVAPLLLVIVFAIFQFGIVFKDWITLTRAVSAGGRALAVCRFPGNPDAGTVLVNSAVNLNTANLTKNVPGCPGSPYQPVTVSATYPFTITIPFLGSIKAGNLSASDTEMTE